LNFWGPTSKERGGEGKYKGRRGKGREGKRWRERERGRGNASKH